MPYYSNERWKDFQTMFPTLTRNLPSVLIWSVIILADIVIAAVISSNLGLLTNGRGQLASMVNVLVICAITGGLYLIEMFFWKTIRRLFR